MNQNGFANIILIIVIIAVVIIGGYFVFSQKSAPAPTTTQLQPTNSQSNYDEKIAAYYPKNEGCSACQPILNNSVQRVKETTRRFVNVPKDLYSKEISSYFATVSGNATAGWISSGGLPGKDLMRLPSVGLLITNLAGMARLI